jgi:hypothetical protein
MRILTGVIAIILMLTSPYQSATRESQCRIQDLAIEAALGDSLAQHHLGVEFYTGKNISQDYAKAATMWRLSGEAGIIESYNNLGYLTYYGKGVKQNYAEGIRLWRKAAANGFAESQIHIGYAYKDGKFLKRDYLEAYVWAKTGKHFASQNIDSDNTIEEMADKLLRDLRGKLTDAEMKIAEKKAGLYIAKYSPKAQ